jgi:hypothetical protein
VKVEWKHTDRGYGFSVVSVIDPKKAELEKLEKIERLRARKA